MHLALGKTSAPIEARKLPALLGNYDWPTDHPTDRPTHRQTDMRAHRKVTLPIRVGEAFGIFVSTLKTTREGFKPYQIESKLCTRRSKEKR